MQVDEILQRLSLRGQHFQLKQVEAPLIDPTLYNTLGKQLFDLYQKYNISEEDQRMVESLSFCLLNFTLARENRSKSWWPFKRRLQGTR